MCQVVAACCLVLAGGGVRQAAAQQAVSNLVATEQGQLPIILSAPHGGRVAIPDVAERTGDGVSAFRTVQDVNTDKLVERLADALEKKLGKRPYTVIAHFHRRYVDANRPENDAYESKNAKLFYDTYHQALHQARVEVIQRWGRGLLLDIHGQAAEPEAIFRGTQNGKTVTHLVKRFGEEALIGETSLFGVLAERGVSLLPAVGSAAHEDPRYDGGYTVLTYGSSSGTTLDAIQLEFGRDLRSSSAVTGTATRLADAIAAFAQEYLPRTSIQNARAESAAQQQGNVLIGVYRDVGAGPSANDLMRALRQFQGVEVRELTAEEIRSGALAELDVLIHPGGSGSKQGKHLGEEGREIIRRFIADGGGYLGICAGAYLASADYTWSLNVLDGRVVDRKHWARGQGMVDIQLTDAGRQLLRSDEPEMTILYAQGPLLARRDNDQIPDYETIATFKTEIAKNGAPRGIMPGTTAIAHGRYGQGRVLCFSPHPEMTRVLKRWFVKRSTT